MTAVSRLLLGWDAGQAERLASAEDRLRDDSDARGNAAVAPLVAVKDADDLGALGRGHARPPALDREPHDSVVDGVVAELDARGCLVRVDVVPVERARPASPCSDPPRVVSAPAVAAHIPHLGEHLRSLGRSRGRDAIAQPVDQPPEVAALHAHAVRELRLRPAHGTQRLHPTDGAGRIRQSRVDLPSSQREQRFRMLAPDHVHHAVLVRRPRAAATELQVEADVPRHTRGVRDPLEPEALLDQYQQVIAGRIGRDSVASDLVLSTVRAEPVAAALTLHAAVVLASAASASVLAPAAVHGVLVTGLACGALVEFASAQRTLRHLPCSPLLQVVHAAESAADDGAAAIVEAAGGGHLHASAIGISARSAEAS